MKTLSFRNCRLKGDITKKDGRELQEGKGRTKTTRMEKTETVEAVEVFEEVLHRLVEPHAAMVDQGVVVETCKKVGIS